MKILAGIFLGWSLGSNDASNVFGTAVAAQMVRWRTAAILIAVFALLGALVAGGAGLETYSKLSGKQDLSTAFCICLAAALTVTIMTIMRIPVSTSQAVVGAIIGVGILQHKVNIQGLTKVVLCWFGTPLGAALLAVIFYPVAAFIIRKMNFHFLVYDKVMRFLLIAVGIYGAFALGANNVANVTGVFYKAGFFDLGLFNDGGKFLALLTGGLSIGFGVMTYSRNVMMTVGRKIIKLDAFSAFVVVSSEAIVVHIYAIIGVPVSTSQAVVGAVLGIGLLKGMNTVSGKTLAQIAMGWLLTPVLGLLIAYSLYRTLYSVTG